VFKPELAHLGILRARFGYAFEQVIRLPHQPLYPLLIGLARYVDHSFTSLKNIPARGGGANGGMLYILFMLRGIARSKRPHATRRLHEG